MSNRSGNVGRYLLGDYKERHPTWHAEDAPFKVQDLHGAIQTVVTQIIKDQSSVVIRLTDVGAGVGLVLMELSKFIEHKWPEAKIVPVAYEIAPAAAAMAKKFNPGLDVRQSQLTQSDGPFDIIMFVDVLEHLENPWDILRTAHATADYIIVRQPLLGNFSRFRHNNYREQRLFWGHIGYFNYRSFLDMAAASGWEPLHVEVLAPWELASDHPRKGSLAGRLLLKLDRVMASFFVDGFYLNGAFRRNSSTD